MFSTEGISVVVIGFGVEEAFSGLGVVAVVGVVPSPLQKEDFVDGEVFEVGEVDGDGVGEATGDGGKRSGRQLFSR